MESHELVAKIRESCFGMVQDLKGQFYDDGNRMSIIGIISLNEKLKDVIFHLPEDFVIKSNSLELRNKIKSQINDFLQA